jgi:hypothetical protein
MGISPSRGGSGNARTRHEAPATRMFYGRAQPLTRPTSSPLTGRGRPGRRTATPAATDQAPVPVEVLAADSALSYATAIRPGVHVGRARSMSVSNICHRGLAAAFEAARFASQRTSRHRIPCVDSAAPARLKPAGAEVDTTAGICGNFVVSHSTLLIAEASERKAAVTSQWLETSARS